MTGEAAFHSVSVAGVVIDENGRTPVIQRRDNGNWEPPGGVLERDESIIEGLLREVREETGLVVEPLALTGVYKNTRLEVVALVFRCRLVGGTLTENSEAAGFRWVLKSEVSAIMPEAFAIRILDALARSTPATPRSGSPGLRCPGLPDPRACRESIAIQTQAEATQPTTLKAG